MSPHGANLAKMDTPFSLWFLYKPPLYLRLRGPGKWAALCPYPWARAAAPACLQVFAATESKILTGFVNTELLFKAFICSGQFYCSFNLSTLVLYRIFDGIKTFFLVLCLFFFYIIDTNILTTFLLVCKTQAPFETK